MIRYRDNKVVSLKGERYTEMKKEESEELKKTYVNLKPAKQYRFHWSQLNKPYSLPSELRLEFLSDTHGQGSRPGFESKVCLCSCYSHLLLLSCVKVLISFTYDLSPRSSFSLWIYLWNRVLIIFVNTFLLLLVAYNLKLFIDTIFSRKRILLLQFITLRAFVFLIFENWCVFFNLCLIAFEAQADKMHDRKFLINPRRRKLCVCNFRHLEYRREPIISFKCRLILLYMLKTTLHDCLLLKFYFNNGIISFLYLCRNNNMFLKPLLWNLYPH